MPRKITFIVCTLSLTMFFVALPKQSFAACPIEEEKDCFGDGSTCVGPYEECPDCPSGKSLCRNGSCSDLCPDFQCPNGDWVVSMSQCAVNIPYCPLPNDEETAYNCSQANPPPANCVADINLCPQVTCCSDVFDEKGNSGCNLCNQNFPSSNCVPTTCMVEIPYCQDEVNGAFFCQQTVDQIPYGICTPTSAKPPCPGGKICQWEVVFEFTYEGKLYHATVMASYFINEGEACVKPTVNDLKPLAIAAVEGTYVSVKASDPNINVDIVPDCEADEEWCEEVEMCLPEGSECPPLEPVDGECGSADGSTISSAPTCSSIHSSSSCEASGCSWSAPSGCSGYINSGSCWSNGCVWNESSCAGFGSESSCTSNTGCSWVPDTYCDSAVGQEYCETNGCVWHPGVEASCQGVVTGADTCSDLSFFECGDSEHSQCIYQYGAGCVSVNCADLGESACGNMSGCYWGGFAEGFCSSSVTGSCSGTYNQSCSQGSAGSCSGSLSIIPNSCASGSAGPYSLSGNVYSWSCTGENGGTSESCDAIKSCSSGNYFCEYTGTCKPNGEACNPPVPVGVNPNIGGHNGQISFNNGKFNVTPPIIQSGSDCNVSWGIDDDVFYSYNATTTCDLVSQDAVLLNNFKPNDAGFQTSYTDGNVRKDKFYTLTCWQDEDDDGDIDPGDLVKSVSDSCRINVKQIEFN